MCAAHTISVFLPNINISPPPETDSYEAATRVYRREVPALPGDEEDAVRADLLLRLLCPLRTLCWGHEQDRSARLTAREAAFPGGVPIPYKRAVSMCGYGALKRCSGKIKCRTGAL